TSIAAVCKTVEPRCGPQTLRRPGAACAWALSTPATRAPHTCTRRSNLGEAMHAIQLTRPGPCSLAWLQAAVAALQVEDHLARVTVVVPSPYLGLVARQALAARGCANVRTAVLREVAAQVAGPRRDTHRGP